MSSLFGGKPSAPPTVVSKPDPATKPYPEVASKSRADIAAGLINKARTQVGVRESGGNNRGKEVEMYQDVIGAAEREPWCLAFQQWVATEVCKAYGVKNPLCATEGCVDLYDHTSLKYLSKDPAPGKIMVQKSRTAWNGHVGLCTSAGDPFGTIEGNTDPAGGSEGDGVYETKRYMKGTSEKLVLGFVDVAQMIADAVAAKEKAEALKPLPQVVVPGAEPLRQHIALSWEAGKPERAAWSDALCKLIRDNLHIYAQAKDIEVFCPGFKMATDERKIKMVGELWVATAYYESAWNPKSQSVDVGTQANKDTWSVGLFQMSVVDQKNYGFTYGYDFNDLCLPVPNITLALAIMHRQIQRKGSIVVPSGPYWAVLFNGKYTKIPQIKARILANI